MKVKEYWNRILFRKQTCFYFGEFNICHNPSHFNFGGKNLGSCKHVCSEYIEREEYVKRLEDLERILGSNSCVNLSGTYCLLLHRDCKRRCHFFQPGGFGIWNVCDGIGSIIQYSSQTFLEHVPRIVRSGIGIALITIGLHLLFS